METGAEAEKMGQNPPKKKSNGPLILILGIFVALVASPNLYTYWKWRRVNTLKNAPTVRGEVLGKVSTTSTRGTPSYSVRYAYEAPAPDGSQRRYEDSQRVEARIFRAARKGNEIAVHYLPADPSVSSLESRWPAQEYWLAACGLIDGLFIFFLFRIIRAELKARRSQSTASEPPA